jgi:AcrR family transcriptional regulator
MVKRTPEQADETRRAILHAARQLFETQGYSATSIASIVDAAGITKGALFHHFPSKDVLFFEIWKETQLEMDAEARQAAQQGRSKTDPYAAFLAGTRVYFNYASKPGFQRVVLIDGPSVMGRDDWQANDYRLGGSNVEQGLRYLAHKGLISHDGVVPLSIMLMNALNGGGFALTRQEAGLTADNLFDAFEALLRGLR